MKKEVLVFVFDGYADWECAYLCSRLHSSHDGYAVRLIASDPSPKISMGGFRVLPDYTLDNCPRAFSLLLLPGGDSWMRGENRAVLPLVEYAVQSKIPIGAICAATGFLAENGLLDHIPHTGNGVAALKSQAPRYRGERYFVEKQAVHASGIITANGSAALEFALEILRLLKARPDPTDWYTLHKKGFYPA